ncbi:MAG: hypothetical protein OIF56_05290 [Cohaesibacter sp.]|nr:hypothetical protein [Cohaesibacter sp.]
MYITFLKFSENKAVAPEFMQAHNEWIAKGFADGVFLSVGALKPAAGGAILAHDEERTTYDARIASDPFVAEGIVIAETHEVEIKRTIPELDLLKASA